MKNQTEIKSSSNAVGLMVMCQLKSSDILEGGGSYHQLSKRSNDLMRIFVTSLENPNLSPCNLMGLASRYMKFKCAIRDLTTAMDCDFTEEQDNQMRVILADTRKNAELAFSVLIEAMKEYQNGND
ncbi:hypothetical protein UFOVP1116_11 [uncultured Caudovirales phage]|uniref:Uncharacterized protein n=1 Tax=uncultured Caudovirales phage TaxID=2100421 RepID=A0A6J5QY00_9CAUD|nr:hypothetical protein UFOVP1116_11 [uncultured Caudovirales phage]CAB4204083.1 hypothetical protein UFOVP1391_31 [uncultured Caudovirales phage]CAB4215580.1 hypothetical protein UFOVP1480_28 [uncultured Caudovirales phage]CAB5229934.1 hypothetical protein UFOVP1568_24 [uncultured Caudovirales phage]